MTTCTWCGAAESAKTEGKWFPPSCGTAACDAASQEHMDALMAFRRTVQTRTGVCLRPLQRAILRRDLGRNVSAWTMFDGSAP